MYKLIVYDSNNEKVAYIDRFTSLSWKQSIGEVDSLSFELPTKEYDQYLRYGIRLDLMDNNTLLQSFYLRARDIGVEKNRYTGLGPLSLLDNIYLPYGFTVQKQNLSDALKALIKEYRTKTLTWKSDWQSCTRSKVDIDSLVGENWYDSVILAKDNLGVYYSNGTIETPGIDLGTDQILNIELRVLASVGEDVGVKIRYATSSDGSNWTWYTNGGKDWEYSDYDEFYRISVIGTQRYIKVKCTLWTQDTYSEDENGNPIGKSPILQAIQVVTTHNTQIGDNNIATFSKAVAKGDIGEVKNLQGLMDLVRNEKLEIKDGFNPVIVKELGEDKTNTVLLHQGMKLTLLDISDDGSSIENYILGYGGGSNIDKLVVVKQDAASIAQYGKRVGQYLNSECVDKAQLETETQEYLDEHKLPSQSFRIRTAERFDINLGDTVKVMIPDKNLTGNYRVIEILQDIDGTIEYTLSNKKISLVDMIITPKEKYIPPPKPSDIKYRIKKGGIILSFKAYSGAIEIYFSSDGEVYRSLGITDKDTFEHNINLVAGNTYYYRFRAIDIITGKVSELSNELLIVMPSLTKPSIISVVSLFQSLVVTVSNPVDPNWDGYEIHVSQTSGFTPNTSTLKKQGKTTVFGIQLGLSASNYYIKAVAYDMFGNKSEPSDEISNKPSKVIKGEIDSNVGTVETFSNDVLANSFYTSFEDDSNNDGIPDGVEILAGSSHRVSDQAFRGQYSMLVGANGEFRINKFFQVNPLEKPLIIRVVYRCPSKSTVFKLKLYFYDSNFTLLSSNIVDTSVSLTEYWTDCIFVINTTKIPFPVDTKFFKVGFTGDHLAFDTVIDDVEIYPVRIASRETQYQPLNMFWLNPPDLLTFLNDTSTYSQASPAVNTWYKLRTYQDNKSLLWRTNEISYTYGANVQEPTTIETKVVITHGTLCGRGYLTEETQYISDSFIAMPSGSGTYEKTVSNDLINNISLFPPKVEFYIKVWGSQVNSIYVKNIVIKGWIAPIVI